MKKRVLKILSIAMVLAMLFSCNCFAECKIITPTENMIVEGDSFNLSIKTDSTKIKVSFYVEQTYHVGLVEKELKLSREDLSDAHGNPVTTIKYKVQGNIYEDFSDTKDVTLEALNNFSADLSDKEKEKTAITKDFKLSDFSKKEYKQSETYEPSSNIGLFAKKYEDFKPGIYEIVIEEINSKGKTVSKTSRYVCVKEAIEENVITDSGLSEKEPDTETKTESSETTETKLTLSEKIINFIKSIFK